MLVGKINQMQHNLDIKDTYNASMIHELRNPLNAIIGSVGLLKSSKSLSKEDLETLNIATVSGEMLITLINNALDGAKLEANKLELDYHMNDVVEILTKAVSLYSWKAKEKKINIQLKIGKDMPDQVEIDEARLAQILINLIGNSVKFTPSNGMVKVRARFVPQEEDQYGDHKRIEEAFTSDNYFKAKEGHNSDIEDFEQKHFITKDIGFESALIGHCE